jgi:hypothetical protein
VIKVNAKLAAVSILLIIAIVSGLLWYQSWSGPLFPSTYNLGEEIKGFPTSEMSLTISNMTISKTTDVPNTSIMGLPADSNYVILTVAIRNLGDTTLTFNQASDFMDKFNKAPSNFVLTYGEENHEAFPQIGYDNTNGMASGMVTYGWHFSINIKNANQFTSLPPHQTVYGKLIFTIGQNYSPNQLLCRAGLAGNPDFAVNLKT